MSREPVGRMQQWDYERMVEKLLPRLGATDPMSTVKLFADLLWNAMKLSEPITNGDPRDHSYVWRPAIEDHEQNLPAGSPRDVLVSGVRDAAVAACQAVPVKAAEVIGELEGRQRSIFRRIALYLLAQVGGVDSSLAVARLMNWEIFNDPALRHEYATLARVHFKDVPPDQVERLLAHLRTPAPMEGFRHNFESLYGRSPSDEEVEEARLRIELRHLAVVAEFLPYSWRARYQELVDRFGIPEHPDFISYSSDVWIGPTSPKTADELLAMTLDEVVSYLREWRPSGEPHADSYDGLGRQLSAAIAAQPEKFSSDVMRFANLDPTYVRAVIDGFDQAIRDNKSFEWKSIVDLAAHVVAQRGDPAEPEDTAWEDRDPGWRWARGSVAHLLTEAMRRSDEGVAIDLRRQVWEIIAPLTEDPEPTPEYEMRYGGSNMDALSLSINTNRGKAMHAVVSYALWVRRDDDKSHPERIAAGLDAMREVRDVLDAHLVLQRGLQRPGPNG